MSPWRWSSRILKTSSPSPPIPMVDVTPYWAKWRSFSAGSSLMCEWALMMPGMMVFPVTSITWAPAGSLDLRGGSHGGNVAAGHNDGGVAKGSAAGAVDYGRVQRATVCAGAPKAAVNAKKTAYRIRLTMIH